jgi:serine phosphatase RsbU (regulator of sigma subunit)
VAGVSDDGLDGVCFFLPMDGRELRVASAHFPVLLQAADAPEPALVAGERTSVGYAETSADQRWPSQRIALEPGSLVVMATDGCTDQIGGPTRTAFGRRRITALLSRHRGRGAADFAKAFRSEYEAWRGEELRRDDMMMLIFRVGDTA